MNIKIEQQFPRCNEVVLYYQTQGIGPLNQAAKELNNWYSPFGYYAGYGGNHVWMHDKNHNRVLIMTN